MAIFGPFHTASPSGAITLGTPPSFFISNFVGGFVGMSWAKNVLVAMRDFWDVSLSTPYAGQTVNITTSTNGPGETIFP